MKTNPIVTVGQLREHLGDLPNDLPIAFWLITKARPVELTAFNEGVRVPGGSVAELLLTDKL